MTWTALSISLIYFIFISILYSIQQQQSTHSSWPLMDHSPGHTAFWFIKHTKKILKIWITKSIFFRSQYKIEVSNIKIAGKSLNIWRLHSKPLNSPWVREKFSREIKKYFEVSENEKNIYIKICEVQQKLFYRNV